QLMALPEPPPIQPAQQTWHNIAARLSGETPVNSATSSLWWRLKNWLIPGALGSICTLLVVLIVYTGSAPSGSEYIAVLNDEQGRPALTAITRGDTANMRIQWQPLTIAKSKNLQLWAISARDGQARSLAVFDTPSGEQLELDTPQLRLIKDADSLLLTEEDVGGSAIDEPSSIVVAKGMCVRFAGR
ncbi:MAG TPA: anti-sigma factor, partial [Cellvibrionaceae bacterium]|nr:anti-sigma factor [Cellvibrionaceae bacterium]